MSQPVPKKKSFLGRDFFLACASTFLTFSSFLVLMPTLPLYIKKIGGKESDIGLVIGFFAVSAVLCRPAIGRWVDAFGRKRFMLVGCVIFGACSILYNFVTRLMLLFPVRILHGSGMAFYTTATSTLIADLIPKERRGEGMGFYSMAPSLAMAVGPPLGWWVMAGLGFTPLFLASAFMSFTAVLLASGIQAGGRPESDSGGPKGQRRDLFPKRALFPALVYVFPAVAQASLLSFLPLLAKARGAANPGLFFSASAIALILTRPFTGKMSDRFGRASTIIPGMAVLGCSIGTLGFASSFLAILTTGFIYGLGLGMISTSIMALTVDRTLPRERGSSIATVASAWEIGLGSGSMLLGFVLHATSFEIMYLLTGTLVLVAGGFFAVGAWRGW